MFHYTYITTNKINGLQYVGDRSCDCNPEEDPYLGSGRPLFKRALKKYGKKNFKKTILELFETKEEAFNAQKKYIKKFNTLQPNGYNISPTGGLGVKGSFSHSEKSKEAISKNGRGISRNKSIAKSEETKKKISETLKKKYLNGEIENAMKGSHLSEEHKKQISKNFKGKKLSEEHKKKISQNNAKNKPWLGKKMSIETREKMSKSRKGIKRGPYKKSTSQSASGPSLL